MLCIGFQSPEGDFLLPDRDPAKSGGTLVYVFQSPEGDFLLPDLSGVFHAERCGTGRFNPPKGIFCCLTIVHHLTVDDTGFVSIPRRGFFAA